MKTCVWVTTRFEGWHRWKDAPDECAYLRDYHRHLFHIRLEVAVTGNNREVEFIGLKACLDEYLRFRYAGQRFESSCEQIAEDLLKRFEAVSCEVSEDGENGATVRRD